MTRKAAFLLAAIGSCSLLTPQIARNPVQNAEFEALQAHFERVVSQRSENLFAGITSVPQWEKRKSAARAELVKMLWHNLKLPDTPPPATVMSREEGPSYILENIVLETAPKVYLTANLYLPKHSESPPLIL